jgi:hypothetical protein
VRAQLTWEALFCECYDMRRFIRKWLPQHRHQIMEMAIAHALPPIHPDPEEFPNLFDNRGNPFLRLRIRGASAR